MQKASVLIVVLKISVPWIIMAFIVTAKCEIPLIF